MKKIIPILIALLFVCTIAYAESCKEVPLRDLTTSTIIASTYIDTGEVFRTAGVPIRDNTDAMALVINLTASSDIDISWQYSLDDVTYFTPASTAKADSTNTVTALTESDWIYFTPYIGNYIRFDFDADAGTGLTSAKLIYKKD